MALGTAFLDGAMFEFYLGERVPHVLMATEAEFVPGLQKVEFVV